MEDDNREILRLLRDNATAEKLEGLKRLIALSAFHPGFLFVCSCHCPSLFPLHSHLRVLRLPILAAAAGAASLPSVFGSRFGVQQRGRGAEAGSLG